MNLGQHNEKMADSPEMSVVNNASSKLPRGKGQGLLAAVSVLIGDAYRAGQVEGPDMTATPSKEPVKYARIGPAMPQGDEGQEYDEAELYLEQMTKAMRIASRAVERFNRAISSSPSRARVRQSNER